MKQDYILKQRKKNMYIFPNVFVIGRVFTGSLNKILNGKNFGETMCIYKDDMMYWYASDSMVKAAAQEFFKKLKKNSNFVSSSIRIFSKRSNFFLSWVKKVSKRDLSKMTNKELDVFWDKYLELYESSYIYSEALVICFEEYLSGLLSSYLKKLVKSDTEASRVQNVLASPLEKSFVKREEDDLLNLALKIKNGKVKDVELALEKHVEKYQWVPFDYGMYIWDKKYFKKILQGMLKNADLENRIVASKKYLKYLSLEQLRLEKELKIDKQYKKYFMAMRQTGYLLDYKKEIFTQIHFYAEKVLAETGKRLGVKRDLVQYYLPGEIKTALKEGKVVGKKILEARQKHCYVRWFDNSIEAVIDKPDSLLAKFLLKEDPTSAKFEGIIASAGKCIGKVKILHSALEVDKVKLGDILVAPMTSPDYVPAMRLAGAIITDEGGVMCHAAIVSRELGIPCVVGTKNATKFLHDGDEVEVDANHNSVRIIRR